MSNKILVGGTIVATAGFIILGRFYGGNVSPQSVSSGGASLGTALQNSLAPDFTLQKLGGGTISLSEFRGKKPVIVDFWASWCPNCRRDMPNLNRYYEKYKDKVEVIGVNLQESESTVSGFVAARGISFPIALDPAGLASSAFGIRYTNFHILIDKAGNLTRLIPGDIQDSDITRLIE